jgi:hypothetical protein
VPVTIRSGGQSSERTFQTLMDWSRKLMQLSAVATILLYGYLIYGMFVGGVGQWSSLSAPDRVRIAQNIDSAILYLNISLGVFLVTLCVLFYDEEPYGYMLVGAAIALYYGVPFMVEMMMPGTVEEWQRTGNRGALAIMNQLRTAALMMAVPGAILTIRDLILRIVDGGSRRKEEFTAMQYGGAVEEEKVGTPILGIFAKCWQLPYCRPAIRKGCPIYHARTRCWRQRVGCMCEENVIRHAMDALIGKEIIKTEQPDGSMEVGIAGLTLEKDREVEESAAAERTTEILSRATPTPAPRNVKIPHNPNIPMKFKVERCRNCVIYNEHQRMKYQFVAPLVVLSLPALTAWKFEEITGGLNNIIHRMDVFMSRLSLTEGGQASGISFLSTPTAVQYVLIGCLVVIGTTMLLRALEVVIFRWKI